MNEPKVFFELDKGGYLSIARNGVLRPQFCVVLDGIKRCGDWCPFFEEPSTEGNNYSYNKITALYDKIDLCCDQGTHSIVGKLTDHRPQGELLDPKPVPLPPQPKTKKKVSGGNNE